MITVITELLTETLFCKSAAKMNIIDFGIRFILHWRLTRPKIGM